MKLSEIMVSFIDVQYDLNTHEMRARRSDCTETHVGTVPIAATDRTETHGRFGAIWSGQKRFGSWSSRMGASTQQYSSVEVWKLKGKHLNVLLKVFDGIV
jgi:hypothetical protein